MSMGTILLIVLAVFGVIRHGVTAGDEVMGPAASDWRC